MRWLLLLAALLTAGPLRAQVAPASVQDALPARGWTVAAGLLPLFAQGYEANVEKQWRPGSRHRLSLSPQWYRGEVRKVTSGLHENNADRVRGYGLAAQHRIYLSPQLPFPEGVYIGYGVSYQHFRMQFQASSWQQEPGPDGLTYYQYRRRDQTETIDRYGAAVVAGRQLRFTDTRIFVDAYLGLGFRVVSSRATLPGRHYAAGMSNYGHAGVYLPAGLRLGVVL